MSTAENKAVFLSYASQDASAVERIAEALRAAGVEVWFDKNELVGGDAWDAKIRKQIAECALFVPVISANTQTRSEGYFRLEWRLADQRTHLMGKSKTFLVPVCIDGTRDAEADVPDSFVAVQWVRARDDAGVAALAQRIRTLLENDAAPFVARSRAGFPERLVQPRATARSARPRRWLAPVAVGAVAVGAALIFWRPRDQPKNPASAPAGTRQTAEVQPVPLTPAHQLNAKARLLFENPNNTRDDLVLAEEYCKQALKLDDGDVEVWATYAELSSEFLASRADTSLERREMARFQAERAMRLAPTSASARFAKACYLRRVGGPTERAESEQLLRQLAQERPNDPRVLNALGKAIGDNGRRLDRADEALAVLARAAAIPAGRAEALSETGWILYILNRFTEAEAAIDASLADQTSRSALLGKVNLTIERGAPEDAQAALAKMPPETIRSDAGVALATRVWLFSRQPEKVLEILSGVTRDYLSSNTGGGSPVDLTRGEAYQLQGKTQAAENAWSAALRVVNKMLEEQPRNGGLQFNRAHLLALLGKREEAAAAMRLVEEIRNAGFSDRINLIGPIAVWALIEPPDRAIERLEAVLKGGKSGMLRIDPRFDMLRGHPRFEALLAEAPKPAAATAASEADPKSVAVLAFENLSDDKVNDSFSDGISEELLNVLAKVPGLKVIARTSAFSFKGKSTPIPEIGRQLGVAYVVEGSVRKVGSQVRITARLLKASDGAQVSSEEFHEELKDVWALQDKIAGVVAEKLQLTLGGTPRANRTVNPDAYALVLEGRFFWNQRAERPEEVLGKAANAFQRALALDPNFAEAHAGLGDVWVTRGLYRSLDGRGASASDDYARAKVEAERALELNPALAEPHVTLGYVAYCERQFAASEQHYARAFAANPNYALAHHWHALLVSAFGRFDDSLREIEQSLRLDPLSSNTRWSATMSNFLQGRVAESLTASDRTLALRPSLVPGHGDRALILMQLGRKEEAAAEAREVGRDLKLEPRWWADSDAVYVLRQVGLTAEADEHARRALAEFPKDDYRVALIFAALGRFAEALPAMEKIPTIALTRVYWHPMWDPFRDDPRFHQLLARLGCAEQYAVARETLARVRSQPAARP